jgi:hypothetical protein
MSFGCTCECLSGSRQEYDAHNQVIAASITYNDVIAFLVRFSTLLTE